MGELPGKSAGLKTPGAADVHPAQEHDVGHAPSSASTPPPDPEFAHPAL
jgi:hypothetical protein